MLVLTLELGRRPRCDHQFILNKSKPQRLVEQRFEEETRILVHVLQRSAVAIGRGIACQILLSVAEPVPSLSRFGASGASGKSIGRSVNPQRVRRDEARDRA